MGAGALCLAVDQGASQLALDLGRGLLVDLCLGGIRPLHRAPWIGESLPPGLDPVEAGLQGDFLAAPFGRDDLEPGGPIHGPSANSPWQVIATSQDAPPLPAETPPFLPDGASPGAAWAHLRLIARPRGAVIDKLLLLVPGFPGLITRHRISGGAGALSLAHHPMLRFDSPGRLAFSPKICALTATGVEPGRHRLAIAARGADLRALPGADGGRLDLSHWPWPAGHEDFLTLLEPPGARLGWTLASRRDDLVAILKDPRALPVTMVWLSNGGRDRAPWNGRHLGVVGIEDGITAGDEGHRAAALGTSRIAAEGLATALSLAPGRVHDFAHVILALPRPPGWQGAGAIQAVPGGLILRDDGPGAAEIRLPLPAEWPFS